MSSTETRDTLTEHADAMSARPACNVLRMQTNLHVDADPALAEIRAGMARHSLTQADLATALGLSRTAVHRRLTGQVDFSLGELRATAQLIHQPLTELLHADTPAERKTA